MEISIIDSTGRPLLDTLIKPVYPIPQDAMAIHGITNEMVKDAPTWPEVHEEFCQLIEDRTLLIYNLDYDLKILRQTISFHDFNNRNSIHKLPDFLEICRSIKSCCVMKLFAAFYGQWDDYREDWKWKKLTTAANFMNVEIEGKAHRALADCKITLGVLQAMANTLPEKPETKGESSRVPVTFL
ncbi:MAG: 3'-5' exonuclease [Endozoicomonas sp.]|uniref:3'-5' exonuclease n=1 Tax=Endozoicomonas sp. TaxID=1892382 RepID=UPI003D9B2277